MKAHILVLVEGFHDRAFVCGALQHLGCKDLGKGDHRRPSGRRLWKGAFALANERRDLVEVAPVDGRDNLLPAAKLAWKDTDLSRLVVLEDDDGVGAPHKPSRREVEHAWRGNLGPSAADPAPALVVGLFRSPVAHEHAPQGQDLERVVATALALTFPERARGVRDWLLQDPPGEHHVSKAWLGSHEAKWYPEFGREAFLRHALWSTDAAKLLPDLAPDLWPVLRAMTSGDWTLEG